MNRIRVEASQIFLKWLSLLCIILWGISSASCARAISNINEDMSSDNLVFDVSGDHSFFDLHHDLSVLDSKGDHSFFDLHHDLEIDTPFVLDQGIDFSTDASVPFGSLFFNWHKTIGGSGKDSAYAISVDSNDNIYIAGVFNNTVNIGGADVTSKGLEDIFITSFSSTGAHRWQTVFGGVESDTVSAIAIDSQDNVYLTGSFRNIVNLGGGDVTSAGNEDIYITSFDSTGTHRWQKAIGGSGSDRGVGIAIDNNDNIYITGDFYNTVNLGGGNVASQGFNDVFLTSFTSTGTHRWQKVLGGTMSSTGFDIAIDSQENVYLIGYYFSTVHLGGSDVSSIADSADVFLTSFSSTGMHRWQKSLGGSDFDLGIGVSVDSLDNIYAIGEFNSTANFGGGDISSTGGGFFLTSFSNSGVHRWQKAIGGTSGSIQDIAIDKTNNLYLVGRYGGTADFGGGNMTSSGSFDVFVTSFNNLGVHRWQISLGGSASYDTGYGIAVDSEGNIYVTGSFDDTVNFGGGMTSTNGDYDIFLAKYKP